MSYYYRQVNFGPGSPGSFVRNIIIINVVVFLLGLFLSHYIFRDSGFTNWLFLQFGLTPALTLGRLHLWQPITYMFLHGSFTHIFFNMFMLWMFGTEVEQKMGTRRFGIFYLSCGIGAGIISYLFSGACALAGIANTWNIPTVGASGAIFGVMMAFALFFPNRLILLFFIIPIRAYYMVIGLGLIQLFFLTSMPNGNVSYIAHIGGMLIGFLFLKYQWPLAGFIEEFSEKRRESKEKIERLRESEEQKKVDAILDKINTGGMHTLTNDEKKFLRERSKRRRR